MENNKITLKELDAFLETKKGQLVFRDLTPELSGTGTTGANLRLRLKKRLLTEKNFELFQLYEDLKEEMLKNKL